MSFYRRTSLRRSRIRPDVTIIHAQRADRRGNVLVWGLIGVQKEAALAARRVVVTVEEIMETLDGPRHTPSNVLTLPSWAITAVCQVERGAFPSYAEGYYGRDDAFYRQWDSISRDRTSFQAWIERYVMATKHFAGFRTSLRLPPSFLKPPNVQR
jgi:glutaconate CoA-transferase subunit A